MMVSDTIRQEKDLVLLVRSKKVIKQVRKYFYTVKKIVLKRYSSQLEFSIVNNGLQRLPSGHKAGTIYQHT
jgi:hypothetical protein